MRCVVVLAAALLVLSGCSASTDTGSKKEAQRLSDMASRIDGLDPQQHPNIAALGGELVSGDGPTRSGWALDVVVDGILARGMPSSR